MYPIRDGALGGFAGKFRFPSEDPGSPPVKRLFKTYVKPLRAKLQSLVAPNAEQILISEENLLGRMGVQLQGRFYPTAGTRLEILSKALQMPIDNALIVIRPYASYYSSAHAKLAQLRHRPTFASLAPRLLEQPDGWAALAVRLLETEVVKRLTVVSYPSRGSNTDLLGHFPNMDQQGFEPVEKSANASPSSQALDEFQKIYSTGKTITFKQRKEILAAYPIGKTFPSFRPFSPGQSHEFYP